MSRNTQPLRVVIVHRLFLSYCTNFVIFQTAARKGIFICGHIGLVQETNSLILQYQHTGTNMCLSTVILFTHVIQNKQ